MIRSAARYLRYCCDIFPDMEQLLAAAAVEQKTTTSSRWRIADHGGIAD
jgi:hypothetical protein